MTTQPFKPILIALNELVSRLLGLDPDTELVGGDLSYDGTTDYYVWIGLVPGGSATELEGEWIVDIDVFGRDYADTMQRALDLEAALLRRGGHVTSIMRLDTVSQNEGPGERFWDDNSVYRIGATYVFTARRPSRP